MNSKILVVVLLAYILDNLSAAAVYSGNSNTPTCNKNSIVFNQPNTNNQRSVFENSKVNPTVLNNGSHKALRLPSAALPAPPSPIAALPAPPSPHSAIKFLPSIKTQLQPTASAPITVPTNEHENYQGIDFVDNDDGYEYEDDEKYEGDEYEEYEGDEDNFQKNDEGDEYEEYEDEEAHLENCKKNDNYQEFETQEYDDKKRIEDSHNVKEYSEDPNLQMNDPISSVSQLSEDEWTENNYDESDNSFNEGNQEFQSYEEEQGSSNSNNNSIDTFETLDRKNYHDKDQLINTNKFELNSNDNTQISNDKQKENTEDLFQNQNVSSNNERIINGYTTIKKILYMLQDYASSTFNWIINKINYRIEQVSN